MSHRLFMIAIALLVGMVAQSTGRRLGIPGITLLLLLGVIVGPDVLGIVQPDALGYAMHDLTHVAVAVILFEGGLALDIAQLRKQGKAIRRLVTIGAATTAIGGTLASHYMMNWPWRLAALFGTLVIVTGPTVVQPIVRRIRLEPKLATVLEAEAVFSDAVGAIVAAVALEVTMDLGGDPIALGALGLFSRLAFGVALGLFGGFALGLLLRSSKIIAEGLENVFALAFVLALFEGSNIVLPESGIMTVSVAGLAVGNLGIRRLNVLRNFKEQLTVMLIAMLFVLLAASVRIADVRALGMGGLWTVFALVFVVRPLAVWASTTNSDLNVRQKLFMGWMAPRGIVAAAVASLFAEVLMSAGEDSATELRALVFLVIAVTVVLQGGSAKWVAKALKVRVPISGYVIVGASGIGICLAKLLRQGTEQVVFVDSHPTAIKRAQDAGFSVYQGTALNSEILAGAGIIGKRGFITLTPNEEVNVLAARKVKIEFRVSEIWVALRRGHESLSPAEVEQNGLQILFGTTRYLEFWNLEFERNLAHIEWWKHPSPTRDHENELIEHSIDLFLPLAISVKGFVCPFSKGKVNKNRPVAIAIAHGCQGKVHQWMKAKGWEAANGPLDNKRESSRPLRRVTHA